MDRPRRVREAGQQSPWKLVCIIQKVNLKLNSTADALCTVDVATNGCQHFKRLPNPTTNLSGRGNVPRWQPNKGASQVEALMWRGGSFTCVSGCAAIQEKDASRSLLEVLAAVFLCSEQELSSTVQVNGFR
jgi:hypothetical protein